MNPHADAGRRGGRVLAALAVLLAALAVAPPAAADPVERYLRDVGAVRLLARHLEERLEAALEAEAPVESASIARRLAEAYTELLGRAVEPGERTALERKAEALLELVGGDAAVRLEIVLLQARYRGLEGRLDRRRLGATTERDAGARLEDDLRSFVGRLDDGIADATEELERADRRLEGATGSRAVIAREDREQADARLRQLRFLRGWSLAGLGEITDDPRPASRGADDFAFLLGGDDEPARSPDEISVDLRTTEPFARAILGMALCRSVASGADASDRWLELLEHPRTHPAVRSQVPLWRLLVALHHGEHDRALVVMEGERDDDDAVPPPTWLRLAAAASLPEAEDDPAARRLARRAIGWLASTGELGQVLDLARRHDLAALEARGGEARGFAIPYIRGVLAWHAAETARQEARSDETARVGAAGDAGWAEALARFDEALEASDLEQWRTAAGDARRLRAWALYHLGRVLDAADAFEQAAESLGRARASEALWMAIVCLQQAMEEGTGGAEVRARFEDLSRRFIASYPENPRTWQLTLARVQASSEITPAGIEELLAIPPSSAAYEAAQDEAARRLYLLFRRSRPPDRRIAADYLDVAVPRLEGIGAAEPGDGVLIRARRVLEIALHDVVARTEIAEQVLAELDARDEALGGRLGFVSERRFRRIQWRLLEDDLDGAVAIAAALPEAASATEARSADAERVPAARWDDLARRLLVREADRRRRELPDESAAAREAASIVARFGAPVVAPLIDEPAQLRQDRAMNLALVVAEAAAAAASGPPSSGAGAAPDAARRLARDLAAALVEARPLDRRVLVLVGRVGTRFGPDAQAVDAWRRLARGLDASDPLFFEARHGLITVLARTDPDRARAVMAQHRLLNPEYGPSPWGERLRALDERLGPMVEGGAGGDDRGAGEDGTP